MSSTPIKDTEENNILLKFKEIMSEDVNEISFRDSDYLRFLRARNYDLDKAEHMLRNHLEWRKRVQLDEASSWEIHNDLVEGFPYFMDGVDKVGRPVFYLPTGCWPSRQFLLAGRKPDMDRNKYHLMAKTEQVVQSSGREQFIVIIDLACMSYWDVIHVETVQETLSVLREFEQNFPERVHLIVFINAPWILNLVFPSIKAIMSGNTLQKIKIFDSDSEVYLPFLLNVIPANGFPLGFKKYNGDIVESWCNANM